MSAADDLRAAITSVANASGGSITYQMVSRVRDDGTVDLQEGTLESVACSGAYPAPTRGDKVLLLHTAAGNYEVLARSEAAFVGASVCQRAELADPFTPSSSQTTLPGVFLPIPVRYTTEIFLVNGTADMRETAGVQGNSTYCVVELVVDGVTQPSQILMSSIPYLRGTHAQTWRITGLTPGNRTFLLTGRTSGGGAFTIQQQHTALVVTRA